MEAGTPLWALDFGGEYGKAVFPRSCPACGRFVAGASIHAVINGLGELVKAEATCSACGVVDLRRSFLGYF